MIATLLQFLVSPLGRWALGIGGAAVLLLGVYTKGRVDGRQSAFAQVERQQKRAIELAMKARAHLEEACRRNPKNCVPEEWFREEGDE